MIIFFEASTINRYAIVTSGSSFYVFGGFHAATGQSTIASFDTISKEWKKVGDLNQARYGHGVLIQQDYFIVVGGLDGYLSTERCYFVDDSVECVTVEPVVNFYAYYPELTSVDENYCQK